MALRWFEGFEIDRSLLGLFRVYPNVPLVGFPGTWLQAGSRLGGHYLAVGQGSVALTMTFEDSTSNPLNPNSKDTLILGFAWRADVSDHWKGKTVRVWDVNDDASLGSEVEQFQIKLVANSNGLTYKWQVLSNSAVVAQTSDIYKTGEWYYFEFKIKVHQTAGTVQIKVDQSTVVNLTALDTSTKGSGVWGHIDLTLVQRLTSGVGSFHIDDVYILSIEGSGTHEDFLGDVIVEAVHPTGDSVQTSTGPWNNWNLVGKGLTKRYQAVDDAKLGKTNDRTYLWKDTDNQKQTFTMSQFKFLVASDIIATSFDIDAKLRSGGSKNIAPIFWESVSGLVTGANQAITKTAYKRIRLINPTALSASFAADFASDAEYGFETKA